MYKLIERNYEARAYNYGGCLEYETSCIDDNTIKEFDSFEEATSELEKYDNEYEKITDKKYNVKEYLVSYIDENEDLIECYGNDLSLLDYIESENN